MGYKYYPPGSPELVNPMLRFKEKACTRCKEVKPNTFDFFDRQIWNSRTTFSTKATCKDCCQAAQADGRRRRFEREHAYQLAKSETAEFTKPISEMTPEEVRDHMLRQIGIGV
jgi:hypothetical protein